MYLRDRGINLKQSSYRPGELDAYNAEYKSKSTREQIPSGYRKGEQMHHLVPAELFGAFVQNLSQQEAEIVINRANALGIRVGNDPANFVGLDKMSEHLRNDKYSNTVHQQLDDIGLESSELAGEQRAQFYGLLDKIANSPLKTRLEALPDFVTYIAEPAIEIGRSFRPQAQGIAANKAQYANELKQERDLALQAYAAETVGVPAVVSETDAKGTALTKLLSNIKYGTPLDSVGSRKAGEAIRLSQMG